MNRFSFLLTSIVFFSTSALQAGTTAQFTITKDPQALVIVQKALAAMGGSQALLAYQDSLATGTLTTYAGGNQFKYPITLKCKGTQETRVEVLKPEGTNIRILNQGVAAIQRPDGTIRNLLTNNTVAERVNHIPLLSILADYQNADISVQYLGTAQVSGQTADIVAVSFIPTADPTQGPIYASMTQTLFFVDQATGVVDKIQYTDYAENDPSSTQKVEVYFGNYQAVNGISVPFHQTIFTDGNLESDIMLQSVSFNVGLTDAEFALPGVTNAR